MKHLSILFCLMASPLMAQDAPADEMDQGFSLLQEGAKLLLRGMATQMEPTLDEMSKAWDLTQPKLMELLAMIDDISNYQAPEMLENGDIIIRRKPAEPEILPKGEIEL